MEIGERLLIQRPGQVDRLHQGADGGRQRAGANSAMWAIPCGDGPACGRRRGDCQPGVGGEAERDFPGGCEVGGLMTLAE